MIKKQPVEKQADRDSIFIRINPIYTNTVDSLYTGWGFNYRNDFYVQAIKDAIDRQVSGVSRFKSEEDIDSFALDKAEIIKELAEVRDIIVNIDRSNEQNFKLLAILSTYAVLTSSGYLVLNDRDKLNEDLRSTMKKRFADIESLNIERMLADLLDKKYDGFKNSVHH